jgi:uncharacterized membrane protein YgdD (TMEM256/DUF423 family)
MLVAAAALVGLLGVALSAVASHAGKGPNLETAARFLLIHAPALLAIVALAWAGAVDDRVARLAAYAMLLGLALFCGDLAMRTFRDAPLFARAAPTGGIVLMLGWALLAVAALIKAWR